MRGEVHDESAWTMMKAGNRVVGSAGLFLSIGDLQLYMQELLRAKRGEGKILTSGTIELVIRYWMGALPGEVRWLERISPLDGATLSSDDRQTGSPRLCGRF